jgi:hypothetical protein
MISTKDEIDPENDGMISEKVGVKGQRNGYQPRKYRQGHEKMKMITRELVDRINPWNTQFFCSFLSSK